MFDWDLDYDCIVKRQGAGTFLAEPATRSDRKSGLRLFIAAFAILLTVVTAAFMYPNLAQGVIDVVSTSSVSSAAFTETTMPAGLLAYDQQQYDRARRGLARFSDDELLDFAGATQATLDGGNPMGAYTHDVLFVTWREIERRGLLPPVPSLRDASPHS